MSPKQKFNLVIEPAQLAALKAIEERTGARISEQIRRAIQAYLENQTVLTKAELKKLLGK
jgi:Ribbon-helix-helix domain